MRLAGIVAHVNQLIAGVERWWTAPDADNGPDDLAAGARLHQEIEARLRAPAGLRQVLTDAAAGPSHAT